jgi:transposase
MLADEVDFVVGVDTHRDQHVLAVVVARTGVVVARRSVRSSARGYAEALRFAQVDADGSRVWAVEGAGHYGAGLARHLSGRGETVLEAGRSPRGQRRLQGKDDSLDASALPALRWRARRSLCRDRGSDARHCGCFCWLAAAPSTCGGLRLYSCAA